MFENNKLLTKAIQSKDPLDWMNFRHDRANLQNCIAEAKSSYLSKAYRSNAKKWKQVNTLMNTNAQITPKKVV